MSDSKTPKPKLITPEGRGSYVTLIKPRAVSDEPDAELKYSYNHLMLKESAETKAFIKKLEAAFIAAMIDSPIGKPIPFTNCKHYPIRDGDMPNDDGEIDPITKGHWIIYATNRHKPGAIDLQGNKLFSEDDLYSGAWYRISVSAWAWSNKFGKGVSLNLDNVLKVRDDAKFGGGGAPPEDDFAQYVGGTPSDEPDPMLG